MGGGGKAPPPTNFSSVNSTKVGISPPKCVTFSFKPFVLLV